MQEIRNETRNLASKALRFRSRITVSLMNPPRPAARHLHPTPLRSCKNAMIQDLTPG